MHREENVPCSQHVTNNGNNSLKGSDVMYCEILIISNIHHFLAVVHIFRQTSRKATITVPTYSMFCLFVLVLNMYDIFVSIQQSVNQSLNGLIFNLLLAGV